MLLLLQGADINGLGEKWTGWNALHSAADAGQVVVVFIFHSIVNVVVVFSFLFCTLF